MTSTDATSGNKDHEIYNYDNGDLEITAHQTRYRVHSYRLIAESHKLADILNRERSRFRAGSSVSAGVTRVLRITLDDPIEDLDLLFSYVYNRNPELTMHNVEQALDLVVRYGIETIHKACNVYFESGLLEEDRLRGLRICGRYMAKIPSLSICFDRNLARVLDNLSYYQNTEDWSTLPQPVKLILNYRWRNYLKNVQYALQRNVFVTFKFPHSRDCDDCYRCDQHIRSIIGTAWQNRFQQSTPRPSQLAQFCLLLPDSIRSSQQQTSNPCFQPLQKGLQLVLETAFDCPLQKRSDDIENYQWLHRSLTSQELHILSSLLSA